MTPKRVRSSDQVALAVVEGGTPTGPEVLFIHGFCQSSMCWSRQFNDPTLQHCRLVAFDLRGHGASDKPQERSDYDSAQLWANDIKAVMDGVGLQRPVLVGWSYGARMVLDFLQIYGSSRVAGVNFVSSSLRTSTSDNTSRPDLPGDLLSDDVATRTAATRRFLRQCFGQGLDHQEFERVLSSCMDVTPTIRRAILERAPPTGELDSLITVPALISHGSVDPIMSAEVPRTAAAGLKHAAFSFYENAGHAMFFEHATRFNRELAQFVEAATGVARPITTPSAATETYREA